MRVFIGIKLSEENKKLLCNWQQAKITDGRLTPSDNLHLTLVFIGEVKDVEVNKIKQVLEGLRISPFKFEVKKMKMMRDMVIGEVNLNHDLLNLQKQLSEKLTALGFQIEQRKYYPHLTLARSAHITIDEPFTLMEEVNAVTLFLSKFTDNGVKYQTLYQKSL